MPPLPLGSKHTPALTLALAALWLLAPARAEGAKRLRAGACARVITPVVGVNHSDPIFMAGFDNNRHATGVHDDLWARGIVLESRGTKIAIVTLDLIGYFNNEIQTARSLVDPARGISSITVTSTHDHEGPDTMGLWGPDQTTTGADLGYLDFVNEQIAGCIHDADDALEPAELKLATGTTAGRSLPPWPDLVADGHVLESLDVDLTLIGGEGVVHVEGDAGPIINASLPVLQLRARSRGGLHRVIATLVNFASHPESLGSNNTLVTSDFPHFAREAIEDAEGGMAIWVSGDLGVLQGPLDIDVEDPDTGLPAPRRTFRWAEVHGEQLAERVVSAIPSHHGNPLANISFAVERPVPVRLDNPFFRFFIALGVLPADGLFTNGVPDPSVGFPFPPPFDPIPQALGEDLHTEVGAFRINEASFAVVPSELDPQIGEIYREHMTHAEHTFIIGLGNDEIGYQLPADKWDNSCHACAPYILADAVAACPEFPPDCNTVFQNNVGAEVDPSISGAILPLIDDLHD
jgi:hypothetical protein